MELNGADLSRADLDRPDLDRPDLDRTNVNRPEPNDRRVVVVTPNPAIDVTYTVARQRIGETLRVHGVHRTPGGKGLNVVRVLANLGIRATAVHPLGGSAGHWISRHLTIEGISTHALPVRGQTRTTVTIADDIDHPTVLTEPGAPLTTVEWAQLTTLVKRLSGPRTLLAICGSLPLGSDPTVIGALVTAGLEQGAHVVVDASGPALLTAARSGASLLCPNAFEALGAAGTADLGEAVRQLQDAGAKALLISRGAEGLIHVDQQGHWTRQSPVPQVSGNPTGAGDAATAGLIAGWIHQVPLQATLQWAAALGAAAVRQPTAGSVDLGDANRLIRMLGGTPLTTTPQSPAR